MTQQSQHLNDCLPTERKLVWRTPEERRMSDLTWVLDWLERRQGKKKQALQVGTVKEILQGRFHSRLLQYDMMGEGRA